MHDRVIYSEYDLIIVWVSVDFLALNLARI